MWDKSLHISTPNIRMETHSGHEHDLCSQQPRLFPHGGVGDGVTGDMWEESGGFSTELSLAWDLVAGDRGLQHFLESGPPISLVMWLKRGGIMLDF